MTATAFPTRRKIVEAMKAKDIGASSATAKCLKEEHKAAVAAGQANGWTDLSSMKEAFTAQARSAAVPSEVLAGFYTRQLEWCGKRVRQLTKALELSYERMQGPEDPTWPKLWAVEAKLRWYTETRTEFRMSGGIIPLLQERGHALVCPQHGIQGVEQDEWAAYLLPVGQGDLFVTEAPVVVDDDAYRRLWDAVSMRGLLTPGGGMLDWSRPCEVCAGDTLRTIADRLTRGVWVHEGQRKEAPVTG